MSRSRPDVLDVIEAAYRVERTTDAWLAELGALLYPHIGAGHGLFGFTYEVTPQSALKLGRQLQLGMPPELADGMGASLEGLPDWYLEQTFTRCGAATSSQAGDERLKEFNKGSMAMLESFGWRDIFIVSGMDPSRHGVYFGAWLPELTRCARKRLEMWTRVAVHLAAAYRLHRRLSPEDAQRPETADAVLSPAGKVEHAREEAAASDARTALRDAVKNVERARGRLRGDDPFGAVELWPGLVSSRWTLVDHVEVGGKRYVLARKNAVALAGFDALTARERQALGFAALGHSNKLVAYEMGIAASTVSVLLHRAAKKLGASSREVLIEKFTAGRKARSLDQS